MESAKIKMLCCVRTVLLNLLLMLLVGIRPGFASLLPYILWDPRNPIFDANICEGGNKIHVELGDTIHLVCPNKATNLVVMDNVPSSYTLYENMHITGNKTTYLNCNATDTDVKLLEKCSQPNTLQYKTLTFRSMLIGSSSLMAFKAGKTYYIFGTGNGTMKGLVNKVGGHCKERNLKLEVYICGHNDVKCNKSRINPCPIRQKNVSSTVVKTTASSSTPVFGKLTGDDNFMDSLKTWEAAFCLIAMFISGSLFVIFSVYIYTHTCQKKKPPSPKIRLLNGYERQSTIDSGQSSSLGTRSTSFGQNSCKEPQHQTSRNSSPENTWTHPSMV